MNDLPIVLSIYVDAPVTIGTLYIGSYEVSYGHTLDVLSIMDITIKFLPKQYVSALDSISLVDGVPGCSSDIMRLLMY